MRRRSTRNLTKINTDATESAAKQMASPEKGQKPFDRTSESSENSYAENHESYTDETQPDNMESLKEEKLEQKEDSGDKSLKSEDCANVEAESEAEKQEEPPVEDVKDAEQGKSNTNKDSEQSPSLSNNEQQANSHISETVQVTDQSPTNDKAVDNTSDEKTAIDIPHTYVQNAQISSTDENGVCGNKRDCSVDQEASTERTGENKQVDNSQSKLEESCKSKKIRLRRTVSVVENSKSKNTEEIHIQESPQKVEYNRLDSEISREEQPVKKASIKIKLIRDKYLKESSNEPTEEDNPEKTTETEKIPKQWSKSVNNLPVCKIDFTSVKQMCTKVDILDEKDVKLELPPERRRISTTDVDKKPERKVSIEYSEESEKPVFEKQISSNSTDSESKEDKSNIIAINRKISIVDDTASKLRPPPEPAKNPVSEILFITNLVRPFTLKHLKELLERTGKIVEDGFWTDKIKSKCYVQYETKEEAEATRNALHGVHWPVGNGKQLMIEYATLEEMDKAKNPPIPVQPLIEKIDNSIIPEIENKEPMRKRRSSEAEAPREEERRRGSGGGIRSNVREWDIGKEGVSVQHRRSRSKTPPRKDHSTRHRDKSREERGRSKERLPVSKHKRSLSRDDYEIRKNRRIEDEIPQKLMDDLFLKTKAAPSIYWQPLSPEEIALKQLQRLQRMEEHKRRLEISRDRRRREPVRGGSYRRR